MVWPAIIAGAATIAGAALSNRANRKMAASEAAMQKEFAQYGIRWKVADAKAAGLHPLYAIGAQTTPYQSISTPDAMGPAIASAGQQIAGGLSRKAAEKQARLEAFRARSLQQDQILMEMARVRSQVHVDTAQANYYNALAAKLESDETGTGGGLSAPGVKSEDVPPVGGLYQEKPREVTSPSKGNAAVAAGPPEPAWEPVRVLPDDVPLPEGMKTIYVPQSDEGWAEDFMEKAPVIAAANAARYYKWLTSDEIAAMYMTPYGRMRMVWMAVKKAPDLFYKLVSWFNQQQKKGFDKARKNLPPPVKGANW